MLHLEICFSDGLLGISPAWYSQDMLQYTVSRHIDTLIDTVKMCISTPNASVEDCLGPTTRDLDDIWRWNHLLPSSYDFCMHEVISEQAQRSPDKVAILAWDGSLTYSQVDQYSTTVAFSLKNMGVELHDVVPVCFEKSKWTVVAVLAVMKAGATFVLMDPTLPLARLQNMAEQVGARTMVASLNQHDLSKSIMANEKILVVEEGTFAHTLDLHSAPKLRDVPSSALMYIIFTSGSTGTPKGVKISHTTYTSSAIPRAAAVGYTEDSRVLDFASYAFDVSIDSMCLTLGNGGCLCIPSDGDRLNDINGVIRRYRVNYAGLTPSVARILDSDVIASLSGLGLGGEAVSARDVNLWGQDTRIIIGYGPCECTIGCTVNSSAATGRDYVSIGKGNGAAIWIVDPSDHESLVPVGAVGELLVEGPIVGQGYLNDPNKTAAAFIENPTWLMSGHSGYVGRRGSLYKTGDLGKYDPDGSGGIIFSGRKDTQVKLRGQRVELGEIESQLMTRLPSGAGVVAEVIMPLGSSGQPTLVAFVASLSIKGHESVELALTQLSDGLRRALDETDLATVLPRYMVPTAYIPVNYIPALISGKTDRKRLREFGAKVDLRQLDHGAGAATRQLTDMEQKLRNSWGQTLKIDPESIKSADNFVALGGDSLSAMKLVSVCRTQGLDLTVADIFSHCTLPAMAGIVRIGNSQEQTAVAPFSMISQSVGSACIEASHVCGVHRDAIEDIYPCTPTQESLFTFSLKSPKAYVAQRVACIPSHIRLEVWKKAWEEVVAGSPILRTRLAQLQEPGLQQVVLKDNISWRHPSDLTQYLESDQNEKMDLGQSLARYAIVDHASDGKRYMVWTVHHVLYDGWSEPLILEKVNNSLKSQHIETQAHIGDFVKYVRNTDEVAMREFWQRELKGTVGPQFPRLPSRDYLPVPNAMVEHQVAIKAGSGPFTTATLIRGAWALVASQYTGSDNVVFGETLTGRDISLPGVESIVGPLIATLPVRIRIQRTSTVESYLQAIRKCMLDRAPFQHMGMQNIRKVSPDAQHACEAGTGLVIQPESEGLGNVLGFEEGDVVREALHFNPYPLMLACGIQKDGFRVCASFDNSLIETAQMERVLSQLEQACLELTKDFSRRVDEISCLPDAELNQIWHWNQSPPLFFDEPSRALRARETTKHKSIYPQAVVPWVCDPQNPSLLSPIGCVGELYLEGAFFQDRVIESPAWLVSGSPAFAGRTGKVQQTGDMVQLRGDGSLIFVGRKENMVPVQGHVADIAEVESQFAKQLPPTIHAAVALFQSSWDSTQIFLFIERQSFEEASVELMPMEHRLTCDESNTQSFETTVCASIPNSLAAALKRLDKYAQDSLPSYMVPSAYIVVGKLPTKMDRTDHNLLNRLASMVPTEVLCQLREGLKEAWAKFSGTTNLSVAENILRSSWAKILGINTEQIDMDDNFFRLGGDSVMAMKLVSNLRTQGHSMTVADIFQNMRLVDAARVLKLGQASKTKAQPYRPFSMLETLDIQLFLSETVRPKLSESHLSIRDVLPVTDAQALDIRGTIQAPRTSIQYTMLYFDKGIEREKLHRACKDLVKAHDILRTVFIEHKSTFFQVVLEELGSPVDMRWTDKNLEEYAAILCTEHIEANFQLGESFLKMFHVEGNDGQCLIIGLSHAQYDGVSLPKLLQDLEAAYTGKKFHSEQFSSYMAQTRNKNIETKALDYWRNLLAGSSLSILAGASIQPTDRPVFHTSPTGTFKPPGEITTASLLTAAWSLVLARRLRTSDVTFGGVTSGRNIDLANVENVMGPCYHLTPIRVSIDPRWTAMDLLRYVQKQSAESAAHDFLGFDKISKHCTQWPSEVGFFDSIVHHQDFEDFDTMPFAGRTCRVDILKPHGDAAYPLKAVSYSQGGQIHVGVVGSERDPSFVDEVLGELVGRVEELAMQSRHVLLLDQVV